MAAQHAGFTLGTFDIHAPGARLQADAVWAALRAEPGLHRYDSHGGFHVVTRFDDALHVLMNPRLFSSANGITLPRTQIRTPHIPAEVDPPAHGQYRALLTPFLTPAKVRALEPAVRAMVRALLDAFPDGESFDFVRAFGRALPVNVAVGLTGAPLADAATLETLVGDLHREVATGVRSGAADRLTGYVENLLRERAVSGADPASDIVAAIAHGSAMGRPLEFAEQVSMVRLLLIGGFDSTSIALSTAVWWLADHPEDAARLRREPALIDAFAEDTVRYASPSTYLRRDVAEDTQLGGQALRKGDQVLVCFGAANRDPARFPDPDTISMDRGDTRHLGFGMGHHRCVGSFIAKLELRVAIEEILGGFASFVRDTSQPVEFTSGLNQGPIRMAMVFRR